jgi:hypothetical protein
LAGFAAFVAHGMKHNVEEAREAALEVGAKMIKHEARRVIGTYDYGWPQLAESTQDDRSKQGYAPNEPLLRTGELRDSINYTIVSPGKLAEIGSNNEIAVYQELGTSTIPARSFLAGSASRLEKPIVHMIKDVVGAAVAGRTIEGEIIHIAIEAAKHLARDVRETVEEMNDDEHHRRH